MARLEDQIRLVLRPERVEAALDRHLQRGITGACLLVEGDAIRSISTGQPIQWSKSRQSVRGLNPSAPGEPPHVLLGRLRQSMAHKVFKHAGKWIGLIGTNVPYGARLELGFIGTDARGRNQNQAPRPFLKPAVINNRSRILQLIAQG